MPGRRAGVSRQIRFRLQWRDGDTWRYVGTADSGWRRIKKRAAVRLELRARAADERARPSAASSATAGGATGRRSAAGCEITEAGHRSTAGADPAGYSAATCSLGG